jgi:hypothetical protein
LPKVAEYSFSGKGKKKEEKSREKSRGEKDTTE